MPSGKIGVYTSKGVPKDPFPKSFEFNAKHYATLVAHPAPLHKYPEPFLCLVGISRYYTLDENTYPDFFGDDDEELDLLFFIRTADPTKVRVAERQRVEDEPKLLETSVGRIIPLLPVAPACASSELKASVDKLFDEGVSGDGQGADIQPVIATTDTIVEDVAPLQPRRQRERKTVVADARRPSHPPKKLREDYGALGEATVAGKSRSAVQSLFTGALLNGEARGEPISTSPFVTSFVSATPEREDKIPVDSVTKLNLRTIGAPQMFVISSDSSHHPGANITEAEVDYIFRSSASAIVTITTITAMVDADTTADRVHVEPSLFGVGSSSTGRTDSVPGGFSDISGSDFLIGGICTSYLREMLDEFAPSKFFASIRGIDHDQLFIEFNVGAARQISLSAEVRMHAEYNIREKRSVVDEQAELLKVRDGEIENFKAQLLLKEAEATKAIRLWAEVFKFEATEKSLQGEVRVLRDHSATLEKEKNELSVKVTDLSVSVKVKEHEVTDLDDQVHELEISSAGLQEKVAAYEDFIGQLEKFQDKKWRSMELAIVRCLNSTEYLSALGAAISKAVENGMQEGLSAGITHGAEGRKLDDVATFNPSAKADYLYALQRLQNVNFSLIAELKSNKDASVDTIINLLCSDDALAERLGLTESQPHANQLMVPIHHSPDQRVIGASALFISLDVSHSRVRKIRENIASHVLALCGVFVPLSAAALEGTEGTFVSAHDTTTALSVTFVSACTIPPISTDDFKVAHVDGQEGASVDGETAAVENINPFSDVSNAELNILE
nr:transposase (putative), gypsy type [Tanacetum cinerariifolium]